MKLSRMRLGMNSLTNSYIMRDKVNSEAHNIKKKLGLELEKNILH